MTTTQSNPSPATQPASSKLAIDGGPKAFAGSTAKGEPKIGVEEFMALARRFGFNAAALGRIEAAISNDDLPPGGPNLARWYSANPRPAQGEVYEQKAREMFGAPFARAVSSGTGSLHAAMVGVGAGPGKEVIVPAMGFLATASAAAATGALPVFCDVDESLQIDPTKIEKLITPRTVAITATHHWGTVADVPAILEIARRHKLKVIEDCAQSPGAKIRGQYVGTLGDVGCFSISAYKIIGGGEGGLVVAKDQRVFDRIDQLIETGGLWRPVRCDPPRYEGELFVGTNYRMSDLEATIDVVQLGKLDAIVERHHRNSRRILSQLLRVPEVTPQKINDEAGEIGYQIRFFPKTIELGTKISAALRAEGVGAGGPDVARRPDFHYYADMFPVTLRAADENALERAHCRKGDCPVADDLWYRRITLGVDQWWTAADCDAVAFAINKVLGAYCTMSGAKRGWS